MADIEVNGKQVGFLYEDTARQKVMTSLSPKWMFWPEMDILLMCFFIDYLCSVENLPEKCNMEFKHLCTNVYVMLVGNKNCHLKDEGMR